MLFTVSLIVLLVTSECQRTLFSSSTPSDLESSENTFSEESTTQPFPEPESEPIFTEFPSLNTTAEPEAEPTNATSNKSMILQVIEQRVTQSSKRYWSIHKSKRNDKAHIPVIAAVCSIIGALVIFLICLVGAHQIQSKQPAKRKKKLMFHKKITIHSNNISSRCLMKTLNDC